MLVTSVSLPSTMDLRESDLVAVRLPPGERWPAILGDAWDARAAVLPVDHRLPDQEVGALLARARPTALLDGEGFRRLDGVPVDSDVGLVMATSGSSGEVRLVEHHHDGVGAAVRASIDRLGAGADDPWLCCLPVAHFGGLLVLLRAATLGAPLRFAEQLVPGFRFASVVPTQLARAASDLGGYRAILVGGAALDPALRGRAPVVTTYGMTESCGGVVYDGVALDGVEVRIDHGDQIQVRGPTLMSGYRLDASATAAAFTADGWLRTHDAGALVNGRLVVHGRLDDVIVTGGEKVWPAEVEAVLRAHPGVADAAVTGRWDPEWGARVVAYVVPLHPGKPPALAALRSFVAEQLARYKAPRELVLLGALPRLPGGKVARSALPAPERSPLGRDHEHVPPA